MMMPSFTSILSMVLVASSALVSAAPIQPNEDIVWNPEITSPKAGDSWAVGSTQTVTWATSNLPSQLQNATGVLDLAHPDANSENLDFDHPLATNFKYTDGKVSFKVPQSVNRDTYSVVLFGDSGNKSPAFSITGGTPDLLGGIGLKA